MKCGIRSIRRTAAMFAMIAAAAVGSAEAGIVSFGGGFLPPQELTNVQALSAGQYHNLALRTDGTVVEWGDTNSTVEHGAFDVPAGLSGVTAISAGLFHSLALKSNGTVVGWGAGGTGQVGNNDHGQTTMPAGLSGVMGIAAGGFHSVALKSNGTVVAWGWNSQSQTNVPAGLSGVAAVAASLYYSVALKSNGTVVAWGSAPTPPANGIPGATAIAAGFSHCLALKADGTVVAWGGASSPTNVPGSLTGVVAIAAGDNSSLALKNDGTVVGWGSIQMPAVIEGATVIAVADQGIASGPSVAMTPQIDRLIATGDGQVLFNYPPTVATGQNISFEAKAQGGAALLSYQWRFNGIPVPGGTNAVLAFTNVQPNRAGNYAIQVTNRLGSQLSTTLKLIVRPPNDSFGQPTDIPTMGGRFLSSNFAATKEPLEPDHAGANSGGQSVWFRWQSPVTGNVVIDTIGSSFDTLLAVYTGNSLDTLTAVAADDDGANFNGNSRLTLSAIQGTVYRIAVDGFNSGGMVASGGIMLNVFLDQPILGTPALNANGDFKFQGIAPIGRTFVVEISTNLVSWTPVATNFVPTGGIISFTDIGAASHAAQFYRLSLP